MASSLKFLCFFILLICSLQIHARDSYFFNRVTRNRDTPATTNTNKNFYQANTNALKENDHFASLTKQLENDQKDDQEPTFIPQIKGTGYGHKTGINPAATTPPLYNMDSTHAYENHNNNNMGNKNNYNFKYKNNKNENDDKKNDATEVKARLTEYSNTNDKNYYNKDGDQSKYNYYGGMVRKGMSDTRFMKNGKYSYDLGRNYGNRENNNGNDMQGYQNQVPNKEEEFAFDP